MDLLDKAGWHYKTEPVVVLDKPGARLEGATVRGARVLIAAKDSTVAHVSIERLPLSFDPLVPAAFALGAVVAAVIARWGR